MNSELFSTGGLSFDRLQAFVLVAQAGGFTKAAGGDSTKQPLLSRQIKELEAFFGVELLRRMGRCVKLTESGEELYRLTRDTFGALADFKAAIGETPPTLCIGAGDSVIHWMILPSLAAMREKMPNVHLKLVNLPTQVIAERVESGELEFGIIRKDAVTNRLVGEDLGSMGFGLFVPNRVFLGKERSSWQAILGHCPIAALEGAGDHRQVLQNAANQHNLKLKIEVECSSFPAVAKAMVHSSLGGILPLAAASELPPRQFTRLEVPWMSRLARKMNLVWSPRTVSMRSRVGVLAQILVQIWRSESGGVRCSK
jgi:DNA-binding transcriptional LysR family regulator